MVVVYCGIELYNVVIYKTQRRYNVSIRHSAMFKSATPTRQLHTLARSIGRPMLQLAVRQMTRRWLPYSRLLLVGDAAGWVLDEEARALARVARQLGIQVTSSRWAKHVRQQSIFYGSHFCLLNDAWRIPTHRVGMAYFHGLPGTGVDEFDTVYRHLCQYHEDIHRIQVSHRQMYDSVVNSGIAPNKVFLIPIAINPDYFRIATTETRQQIRDQLGIPASSVVIGSFQKDGNGWGEGREPKLIKGPDIFLSTLAHLKAKVPELFVLLSGPARGYVKAGLEQLSVPYRHVLLQNYAEVGQLYQALDAYIVASRQEGGPKAVLEAMASGVPLISTRVGQATDLIQHGINGWLADVEDAESLAHWTLHALTHVETRAAVVQQAAATATAHTYAAQLPLWHKFMHGFVEKVR